MARHTKKQTYTNENLEAKAQELIHMVFTMSEERAFAAPELKAPIGDTLAEAAMAVKYSLRTFLAVSCLQGK